MFLVVTILLSYVILPSISQTCLLPISPTEGSSDPVICDNTCAECNVICNGKNQCQLIKIYSGALTTTIECTNEGSCTNAIIYIGDTNHYPVGYFNFNFHRDGYDSFSLVCNEKTSCLGLDFYVNGNFINGGTLNADSNGFDGFKDGYISVLLSEQQIFNLNCGASIKNCDGTSYVCNGGNCQCNNVTYGTQDGCSVLSGNYIINTGSPTVKQVIVPTIVPTKSPTVTRVCNQPIQPIIPQQNDVIICNNWCAQCEVKCLTNGQCFRIQIFSGALNTTVICKADGACSESKMYIGDTGVYPTNGGYSSIDFYRNLYEDVIIDCSATVACTKSTIIIDGSFSDAIDIGILSDIGSNTQDSFKDTSLEVTIPNGGIMNLNCGTTVSNCAGVSYTCFEGKCQCSGVCVYVVMNSNTPTFRTDIPTLVPTRVTLVPTQIPTQAPTYTNHPTLYTYHPTLGTILPTFRTDIPTNIPTIGTVTPTTNTIVPTKVTKIPTLTPSMSPSQSPTAVPSFNPSYSPSQTPTNSTSIPSSTPSLEPTNSPTFSTQVPTKITQLPTLGPSLEPTSNTDTPTSSTSIPTKVTSLPTLLTNAPSKNPTMGPTQSPSKVTSLPTLSSLSPSKSPSQTPTSFPSKITLIPTITPTLNPSKPPTVPPTNNPSNIPTTPPTNNPSTPPTNNPSAPSISPSLQTIEPTSNPTIPGELQTSKAPFRTAIIVITIVTILLLFGIGNYYLYRRNQSKKESQEDVAGLDSAIPMSNYINGAYEGDKLTDYKQNTKLHTENELNEVHTNDVDIKYSEAGVNDSPSGAQIVANYIGAPTAEDNFLGTNSCV